MLSWPWKPARLAPSGFFALRTPLLPLGQFLEWGEGVEAPAVVDQPNLLEGALQRDRALLGGRLQAVFDQPPLREALFLGSPDLERALDGWKQDRRGGRGPGVERALVRYFSRMSSRPTPFGLFAGNSTGTVGPRTRLECLGRGSYRRHTELDVEYLAALTDELLAGGSHRDEIAYVPNSSLYRAAGCVRYVERRSDGGTGSRHLVSVPLSAHLDVVLDRATPATRSELVSALAGEGVAREVAERYVDRLVDHQILVSRLHVPVTGPGGLPPLVEQLRANPGTAPAALGLEAVDADLRALDAAGLGNPVHRYGEIVASLSQLGTQADPARLFQVQLVKPAPGATLGMPVVEEIRRGVAVLHRLARPLPRPELDAFCRDFARRYQDREVPLLEALDPELGVGFGSAAPSAPLLDGLSFPEPRPAAPEWGRREELLLGKLSALAPGERELTLDQADVDAMADPCPTPLPDAFAVLATVAAAGDDALDRGRFFVRLRAVGGPSGAWLLGRFCHADPQLRSHVEQHLADEEAHDPDAAWAEIVHLPPGRFANVVIRPVLRRYEVPYLGVSGAPVDHQIPAGDLLVSVRAGHIVLRSGCLGCRVVPRLTTAHEFTIRSVPAYRFLCELQFAGVLGGLAWSWGALAAAPFLPRVRTGRLVLAPARWRVEREELDALGPVGDVGMFERVARWRAGRGLPRLVSVADGDRSLMADFDNVLSVEAFVDHARSLDEAILEECFPGPGDLCARGPEGAFAHELVVPFVATVEPRLAPDRPPARDPAAAAGAGAARAAAVTRRFPPGSEWLYAKLYAAPSLVDALLRDTIAPLRDEGLHQGTIDAWHFLRYEDPDWHLRVRFHGGPGLRRSLLPALEAAVAPWLADGRVWRLQLDTYERELERYGGPEGIRIAERIFAADSDMALDLLAGLAPGDGGADERWRTAVLATEALLDDLTLSEDEKGWALRDARRFAVRQLGADQRLQDDLSRRFRHERPALEARSKALRAAGEAAPPALRPLRARSQRLAPAAAELRSLEASGLLSATVADLAVSYVHMSLNRLLRSSHRRQELVIYDFLLRLQRSRLARPSAGHDGPGATSPGERPGG